MPPTPKPAHISEKKDSINIFTETTTYSDNSSGATITVSVGKLGLTTIKLHDSTQDISLTTDSDGTASKANGPTIEVKQAFVDPNDTRNELKCSTKDGPKQSLNTSVVDAKQSDEALRRRVQDFANQHRDLVNEVVAKVKIPVAHYNGNVATFEQILKAPAHFEGCPAPNPPACSAR